jgi:hypothetical protein
MRCVKLFKRESLLLLGQVSYSHLDSEEDEEDDDW